MANIYVTRKIPEIGIKILKERGHKVDVSDKYGVLSKDELIAELGGESYDAVLCLLTDKIDADIFDAAPNAKIFANYAVGYNNIDVEEAKKRGVLVSNTPGVLTDTVAEHTIALLTAISRRIVEADKFTRAGEYTGWAPELFLGSNLRGKIIGILGAGRIGSRVAEIARRGYEMDVIYYDINRNEDLENATGAVYKSAPEDVLSEADYVSVHVPLLDSTRHLIDADRIGIMKSTAYIINTSRGPVIDENALVDALGKNIIKGAALDVFEEEPLLSNGLSGLSNVILTPHIASATEDTRSKMSEMAAQNILSALDGSAPPNAVV